MNMILAYWLSPSGIVEIVFLFGFFGIGLAVADSVDESIKLQDPNSEESIEKEIKELRKKKRIEALAVERDELLKHDKS